MEEKRPDENKDKNLLALGLSLGVVFGLVFDNLAIGISLGIVFGCLLEYKGKGKK